MASGSAASLRSVQEGAAPWGGCDTEKQRLIVWVGAQGTRGGSRGRGATWVCCANRECGGAVRGGRSVLQKHVGEQDKGRWWSALELHFMEFKIYSLPVEGPLMVSEHSGEKTEEFQED